MPFNAEFFDGLTAMSRPVRVEVRGTYLFLHQIDGVAAGQEEHAFSLSEIEIQPRLGKARRIVDLPGYGRLEADDIGDLDQLIRQYSGNWLMNQVYKLESRLHWVLLALLLSIGLGWAMLKYGVPAVAKAVTQATSPQLEKQLGEQIIKGMDFKYGYFSSSRLPQVRQDAISNTMRRLCEKQQCPSYQIEFRQGKAIGANAFALPGGFILLTDELVRLSHNDEEVVAVLAHEMGHVQYRHAMQQTLQGTLAGLVLVALTGDFNSIASGLPAVVMQLSYSRKMELEADQYALHAMQKACISPHVFADILTRLSQKTGGDSTPELISSHPATKARVQPFLTSHPDCKP